MANSSIASSPPPKSCASARALLQFAKVMALALNLFITDTQSGDTLERSFERFPVRIGRNSLNDLCIEKPFVSQFHAALELTEDRRLFARDLGSTNGTVHRGERVPRDAVRDITAAPELTIGPITLRMEIVNRVAARAAPKTVLDGVVDGVLPPPLQREVAGPPGAEQPFLEQLTPYIQGYREAWAAVYGVLYDQLTRLPDPIRKNYLRRLAEESSSVRSEVDFQKLATYYGVNPQTLSEAGPAQAALAALGELAQSLMPGAPPPTDVPSVLALTRRLRDGLEVFLKCFVSLRDGHKEFAVGVLAQAGKERAPLVQAAPNAEALARVLFFADNVPDAALQLHDSFVDVMSHQVALLSGVMEGVKTLLRELSPERIEEELERKGKKSLFASRYEALWQAYGTRHADYASEDKETFLIIFGPQFSKAYAQSVGEALHKGPSASRKP